MLKLNKKSVKILSIVLLVAVLLVTFVAPSFAISESITVDDQALNGTNASAIAAKVLGALKWIGVAVAIGMLIFLGIKYVTSSPDGKADLKKQLGIYVLGFVMIIGATAIVGVLETTFSGLV